jgi:hypothetical protein
MEMDVENQEKGVTLDGNMQAPGRPDVDRRNDFKCGGWAVPQMDELAARVAAKIMTDAGSGLLLGRRSYGVKKGYRCS